MTITSSVRKPVIVFLTFAILTTVLIALLLTDGGFRFDFTKFLVSESGMLAVILVVVAFFVLLSSTYFQLCNAARVTLTGNSIEKRNVLTGKKSTLELDTFIGGRVRPPRLFGARLDLTFRVADMQTVESAVAQVHETAQNAMQDNKLSDSERDQLRVSLEVYKKSVVTWSVTGLRRSDAQAFVEILTPYIRAE